MLTVGSLFSGIGGFDLGLERAGMRTVWFCEQDEFCQRVLAKHWPGVPVHSDVRTLVADANGSERQEGLRAITGGRAEGDSTPGHTAGPRDSSVRADVLPVSVPYVDILCGGFPCQDLSYAGKGAGLDGERSGLWSEYARLIRELRPRYVVVENVSALLARGLGRVLGDLAACGYDAEWDCIPASAIGAPHRRDRVFLVAYASGTGLEGHSLGRQSEVAWPRVSGALAHTGGERLHWRRDRPDEAEAAGAHRPVDRRSAGWGAEGWWAVEPDVGRVAHGVPARVDRLRALGNALVPQIAEWIGRRIIDYEGELADAA